MLVVAGLLVALVPSVALAGAADASPPVCALGNGPPPGDVDDPPAPPQQGCLALDATVLATGTVHSGDLVRIRVVASSTGQRALRAVQVTVPVPAGTTATGDPVLVDGAPTGALTSANATAGRDRLDPGTSLQLEFTVRVGDVDAVAVAARATAVRVRKNTSADPSVAPTLTTTATASVPVVRKAAVRLAVDGPATADAGAAVTYRIHVTSAGGVLAGDVVVAGTLPAGATAAGADAPCAVDAGALRCPLGDLAPGTTSDLGVRLTLPSGPDGAPVRLSLTASSSTPLTSPPSAVADASLAARLAATGVRTAPATVVAGSAFDTGTTVRNTGNRTIASAVVQHVLPAGVVAGDLPAGCTASASVVSCAVGPIAPGASVTSTVRVRVVGNAAAGTVALRGGATVRAGSDELAVPVADAPVAVTVQAGPWVAFDAAAATVVAGAAPGTLTVRYGNTGPSDARDLRLTIAVPPALVVAPDPACSRTGDTLTCPVAGPLVAGASGAVVLRVSSPGDGRDGTTGRLQATVATTSPAAPADPAVSDVTVKAQAALDVAVTPAGPFTLGAPASADVTVTNRGPSVAAGTAATITVAAALGDVAVRIVGGAACTPGTSGAWQCSLGSLASGTSVVVRVTGTVRQDATPGQGATIAVTASTATPTASGQPATASATVRLTALASLSVALALDSTEVVAGLPVAYRAVVANAGPSRAEAVTLVAVPGAGLTLDVPAVPGCARDGRGGVRCDLGTVLDGRTIPLTGAVAASATDASLRVEVSTATPDAGTGDDAAQLSPKVVVRSQVVVGTAATTGLEGTRSLVAGTPATVAFTVTATGPSDLSTATVTFPVPATVPTTVTTSGGSLTCTPATGSVTCTGPVRAADRFTITAALAPAPDLPADTPVRLAPQLAVPAGVQLTGTPAATVDLVSVTRASLQVASLTSPPTAVAGTAFTATATVASTGPSLARDARVTAFVSNGAALSGGLTVTLGGRPCTTVLVATQVTCPVGDVAPGTSLPLVLSGTVDDDAADSTPLIVQVLVESATPAPPAEDPGARRGRATTTVAVRPDLVLAASSTTDPRTGTTVLVELTNQGPSTARTVHLDVASGGAAIASVRSTGLRCDPSNAGAVTCTLDRLGATAAGRVQLVLAGGATATTADVVARASSSSPAAVPDRSMVRISAPVPVTPRTTTAETSTALPVARAGAAITAQFTLPMPAPPSGPDPVTPPLVVRQTVQPGLEVVRADITGLTVKPSCAVDSDKRGYACVIERVEPGRQAKVQVDAVVVKPEDVPAQASFARVSNVYFADGAQAVAGPELSPNAVQRPQLARQAMELLPDAIQSIAATSVRVAPFRIPAGLPLAAGVLLSVAFLGYLGGRTVRGRRQRAAV